MTTLEVNLNWHRNELFDWFISGWLNFSWMSSFRKFHCISWGANFLYDPTLNQPLKMNMEVSFTQTFFLICSIFYGFSRTRFTSIRHQAVISWINFMILLSHIDFIRLHSSFFFIEYSLLYFLWVQFMCYIFFESCTNAVLEFCISSTVSLHSGCIGFAVSHTDIGLGTVACSTGVTTL